MQFNQYLAKEWDGEEVPASYLLQVQHYLAVTGMEKGYIAVLIGGQKFVWKEVQRDEELIEMIIEEEKSFWKMVQDKTPPMLDGSSAAEKWINSRYEQSDKTKEVALTSDYKEKIKQYNDLKIQEKTLKEQIKEIENDIKLKMEEAEKAYVGMYEVNWKSVSSKRVDSKLLKSEYSDIYEKVVKESLSRRFTIKEVS